MTKMKFILYLHKYEYIINLNKNKNNSMINQVMPKDKQQQKTQNTTISTKPQQVNTVDQQLNGQLTEQQKEENKNYNMYMQDAQQLMNIEQVVKRLQVNQIIFDKTFQQYTKREIEIIEINQTKNGQACSLKIKLGSFKVKINILNVKQKSLMHSCDIIGSGAFGKIYQFQFEQKIGICKCIQYNKFVQKNQKTKEQIQDNIAANIGQILKQVCFIKIFSILEIGPYASSYFGFDLIFYNECIQFTMQKCSTKSSKLKNFKQQLKNSLNLMHKLQIVHRDIKQSNILFSNHYQKYVFCDFGTVINIKQKIGKRSLTQKVGTLSYMSPKMLAMNNTDLQFINLYHNDSHCLSITCQRIKLTHGYSYQPERYLDSSLTQYCFILLKYWVMTENFHLITNYFKINKNQTKLKADLLQFVLEMTPNQKIRKFFIDNYINSPNSKNMQTLCKIYGKKNIINYLVPEDQQKKKINDQKISKLKKLKKKQIIAFENQCLSLKNFFKSLIMGTSNNDVTFQQFCQTYIIFMANRQYVMADKIKISEFFYKRNNNKTNKIEENQQGVKYVFQCLRISSQYVIHKAAVNKKEILLKNLLQIFSNQFINYYLFKRCLLELKKISNKNIILMSFAFLYRVLTLTFFDDSSINQIFYNISKSQNNYEATIAQAIIRLNQLLNPIYKQEYQKIKNTIKSQVVDQVNNIISLINRRIDIDGNLELMIVMSYANLFKFYHNQGLYLAALQVYNYLTCSQKLLKFKRIFVNWVRKKLTQIYLLIGDKNKIRSIYKYINYVSQDKDYEKYLQDYYKNKNNVISKQFQQRENYGTFFKLQQKKQQQFFILVKKYNQQKQLSINQRVITIKKLEEIIYQLINQKIIKQGALMEAASYVIIFCLEKIKQHTKDMSSLEYQQCDKHFHKVIEGFKQLIGNFNYCYHLAEYSMIKLNYQEAFYLFMSLQDQFFVSHKGRKCLINAVICFQFNFVSNSEKISFPKQKIQQLLEKYFKSRRQLQLFALQNGEIYCFQLFIQLCIQNRHHLSLCFEEIKWYAIINSKYDSTKLYHIYITAVKAICKAKFSFNRQLLTLIFNSKFYLPNSNLKQISLLAGLIINKIYRKLDFIQIKRMIHQIIQTFNFISKQTKKQIINFLYKVISHYQENKRKKQYLMKKHFKVTLEPIKKDKFITKYNMKTSSIAHKEKIQKMAMKIPKIIC